MDRKKTRSSRWFMEKKWFKLYGVYLGDEGTVQKNWKEFITMSSRRQLL